VKALSNKEGIVCPICGKDVDPDAEFCVNCGSPMEAVSRDDTDSSQLDDSLASLEELVEGEPEEISVCPKCGDFITPSDITCSMCGFQLQDIPGRGAESAVETTRTADAMFLCPECGAFLTEDAMMCDICGASLSVEKRIGIGDFVTKTEEVVEEVCPECGAYLDESTGKCIICSKEVPLEEDVAPPEERDLEEDLDKFLDELGTAEIPAEAPEDLLVKTIEEETMPETLPEIEEVPLEVDETLLEMEDILPEMEEILPEMEKIPPPEMVAPPEAEVGEPPPAVPRTTPHDKFLQRRRIHIQRSQEFLVYSSLIALTIYYVSGQAGLESHHWIMLVVFGVIFGSGLSLSLLNFPVKWKAFALKAILFVIGSAMIVSVPLLYTVGASNLVASVDLEIAIAGGILSLIGIVLMRRNLLTYLIWSTGSLLVFLMTFSSVGLPNPWVMGEAATISLWAFSFLFITLGVALVLRSKWIKILIDAEILAGDKKYKERRFKDSIASYDKAISASSALRDTSDWSSNLDVPWYSKGAALTILGKYEEAIECIDNALKLSPNNEVALVNKGTALARLGRHRDALKCYNEAIRVNPNYEVAWNNKGNALTRLRRYPEALKCYDRAIQIDEEYREAWVNKGYVLAKMGDYDGAARCADFVSRFTTSAMPGRTERLIS
jgi:tetratricopeptide (TPR) repeat protein/predicted amidophosphoribosyltransferase